MTRRMVGTALRCGVRCGLSCSLALAVMGFAGCQAPADGQPQGHLKFNQPRLPLVPPVVPTPINPTLQQKALDEIARASDSKDAVVRAQALEATSRARDPNAAMRVGRGLSDPAWQVRFAAAMCAGDLKLSEVAEQVRLAADDNDLNVRVAARYAMHKLGDKSRSKDLEALATNNDPRIRANVAMVVGLIGEPTGVRVLKPMLADPTVPVRIAASAALWQLKDEQGLKNLIAGTISPFPDDQIDAVLALAAPRDPRVKDNIIGKLAYSKDGKDYVELQLAAARGLGMLGSDEGYGLAVEQAASTERIRRQLAAFALGEIGRADGQTALAKLLTDNNADVRLAAAVALRQIGNRGK